MEERGVLVAIAGRRVGVRVYALGEVRRAVEWRIDVESPERYGSTMAGGDEKGRRASTGQCHASGQRGRCLDECSICWGKGGRHKRNLTNSPSMDITLVGAGDPGGPTTTNPVASTTDRKSPLKNRPLKAHKESRSRDSNFSCYF